MKIKQTCCYAGRNYNLLPAVLVTPKDDGFIVALKWWNWHVGVYVEKRKEFLEQPCCPPYWHCHNPDITDCPSKSDVMYKR